MLMSIDSISKSYNAFPNPPAKVLHDVTLNVDTGEAIGLVGESGSGKSTIAKCMLALIKPEEGTITYDGIDVIHAKGEDLRRFRREVQMVFQDPYGSLNPRMTVEELIGEGLLIHKLEPTAAARRKRVAEMMEMVGLNPNDMDRYTRSFSGGQRQRIAIARALVIRPRILVCDEPVAALDVSVQAQVINLLQDMQKKLNLAIVFVAHDLAVVRHLCEKIVVLHKGKVVEQGTREQIFDNPEMPYTQSLLAAVPVPDPVVGRARRAARRLETAN
ncbi:peptide/nickel transport system ATP-binding protein/oligopeptide transport system ATP-binding protein [Aminobacter aminovorans]|jgi:peptide/nickel transport system ATP-binding protein/oligopeptide transport system ATP-binding protein|uniref:Glutathione import ATP-binding protein GsiA n=1 Tax=Aminobacter aminovorans TaxID=83263 RepID=A0A380WG74_AMIAI|nr:ATP-binding cassette domain-containing protein [Aminobacter aminovorans]TCS24037.1 peptide/nickel transport system ATP-binding protein/oligopeptide transport system ATP-binding protein [Aminobacter aminovorans]SUU87352.1 Glutathione import ATP-binding protein GsiA [Aminobacter aminovorans]